MKTIKKYFEQSISALRAVDWRAQKTKKIAGGVIASIIVVIFVFGGDDTAKIEPPILRSVKLIDVASYTSNTSSISLSGSRDIVVRAETGGKIVRTSPAGTRVAVGDIVAEIENSAQRAALLQTEGALDAARAGAQKTQGGLRSEQISIRETSLESAKSGAVNVLLSAYATVDTSINDTADKMFYRSGIDKRPIFTISTKNESNENQLEQIRFELDKTLERELSQAKNVTTTSDLIKELETTETEVRKVRNFTDMLLVALTDAIPTNNISESQILSHKASVTTARTSLTSTLSALASARTTLETAEKSLDEGLAYTQDTDLAQALAGVKQAQGAYGTALAAYQKTLVRASVSGVVSDCSAELGDVINIGADVCRIATTSGDINTRFTLPLSAVRYTPVGAYVLTLSPENTIITTPITTGLVTASSIDVAGLSGTERIVLDVRGLKDGEQVEVSTQ